MADMKDEKNIDPIFIHLKRRRLEIGMTQKEFSRRSGLRQSMISELENGHTSPTLKTLRKVIDVLGCGIHVVDLPITDFDKDILFLKSLTPEQLERELNGRRWYVHPDDVVGVGFCVMPIDAPPSFGCFPIAQFADESDAVYVVNSHNSLL
jgi:transcriptional regulator with XRE-family HTH domain